MRTSRPGAMTPAAPTKPPPRSQLHDGRDCLGCILVGRGLDQVELLGTEGPKEGVIEAVMYFSKLVPGATGWIVYDASGVETASGPVPKKVPHASPKASNPEPAEAA